jgi:transcriptional regulator with XRE-family HTH domain
MSRLIALIDEYKDTHGAPSDSSIARAVGIAPQTISSWRKRGIRQLPDVDTLRRLAEFIGCNYGSVVLPAVMVDIGYMTEPLEAPTPSPPTQERGTA